MEARISFSYGLILSYFTYMRYFIFLSLLLLSSIAFCQNLPIQKLKTLGLTEAEIEATSKLNGKNGVNGYFVLARIISNPADPLIEVCELYTPAGEIFRLTKPKISYWRTTYFDILDNYLVIIEKDQRSTNQITISRFDLKGEMEQILTGTIPCHYTIKCKCINEYYKRIALFNMEDETEPKIGKNGIVMYTGEVINLRRGTVHEYNWQTGKKILLSDEVSMNLDAVFRGYTRLGYVTFNGETKHFEYLQK